MMVTCSIRSTGRWKNSQRGRLFLAEENSGYDSSWYVRLFALRSERKGRQHQQSALRRAPRHYASPCSL